MSDLEENSRSSPNFSQAFQQMASFVAIAKTRNASEVLTSLSSMFRHSSRRALWIGFGIGNHDSYIIRNSVARKVRCPRYQSTH